MILGTDYIKRPALLQPVNDTDPCGGAMDPLMRWKFPLQLSAPAVIWMGSDGADARNMDLIAFLSTGVRALETKALNGATGVTSIMTPRRLWTSKLQTVSATRTVTVREGSSSGPILGIIPPNEQGFTAPWDSQFSVKGATTIRWAKMFIDYIHPTLAAVAAGISIIGDTLGVLQIGVENEINGTQQTANRLTGPPDVTMADDNIEVGVPGIDLPPLSNIGAWLSCTLNPSHPAFWDMGIVNFAGNSA